jgi:hypothetical protein
MRNFINLPAFTEDGDVRVVIETPRGSRAKLAYDPELEAFTLSKSLLVGLTYPHDWGFVPSTKADDGDPLDIMVVHDAATFPGLVLTCRVIGISRSSRKAKARLSETTAYSQCPASRTLSRVFVMCETFRSRCRKSWRGSSLPRTSLRIRNWRSSAGKVPRWR